jgi:ATP-dependent protease ClpP protease subunit
MRRLLAVVVVLVSTAASLADTLEKTNGQKLDGRVIAETADTVTFEVASGGITFTQRIPRAHIRNLQREVREGPGYCAIPLSGDIGVEITAKALQQALNEARRFKPQYIILIIDSNGGLIAERDKIVGILRENQDLKIIAYVRNAYSAAAVIALACPQMYIAPDAAIGAAVAYRRGPKGVPQLLEEKYRSAIRAAERAASELGNRSELWIRGMSDGDLELSIVRDEDGTPKLVEGNPEGSTRIKRKNEILTATGREAAQWGMASGMAASVEELKAPLGLKVWHNADRRPGQMMAESGRIARQHLKEQVEADSRRAQRSEYLRQLGPEVHALLDRAEKAKARALAADQALADLKRQYDADVAAIEEEYRRSTSGDGTRAAMALAQGRRQRALADLSNRVRPQKLSYEEKRNEAILEASQIHQRLKIVMANLPPE